MNCTNFDLDFLDELKSDELELSKNDLFTNISLPVPVTNKSSSLDVRNLAKRIANVNDLVLEIKSLTNNVESLQNQLFDLSTSSNNVQQLYNEEKCRTEKLTKSCDKYKELLKQAKNDLANKSLKYDQILHLQSKESEKPTQYNELCLKYLKLYRMLEVNSFKMSFEISFKEKIRKYISIVSETDISVRKSIKAINLPGKYLNLQDAECSSKLADDSKVKNASEQTHTLKSTMSQGTQYVSSTTTRGTSTSTFIKKHNVSTNFPEIIPISIEEILKEMIYDVRPISPIHEQQHSRSHQIAATVATKSKSNNTDLRNVRLHIDYVSTPSVSDVKKSDSRPPSRVMYSNVKREISGLENEFNPFGDEVMSISELWNLLGQTIFALIRNGNPQINQTQIDLLNERMGLISEQLQEKNNDHDIIINQPNYDFYGNPFNNENYMRQFFPIKETIDEYSTFLNSHSSKEKYEQKDPNLNSYSSVLSPNSTSYRSQNKDDTLNGLSKETSQPNLNLINLESIAQQLPPACNNELIVNTEKSNETTITEHPVKHIPTPINYAKNNENVDQKSDSTKEQHGQNMEENCNFLDCRELTDLVKSNDSLSQTLNISRDNLISKPMTALQIPNELTENSKLIATLKCREESDLINNHESSESVIKVKEYENEVGTRAKLDLLENAISVRLSKDSINNIMKTKHSSDQISTQDLIPTLKPNLQCSEENYVSDHLFNNADTTKNEKQSCHEKLIDLIIESNSTKYLKLDALDEKSTNVEINIKHDVAGHFDNLSENDKINEIVDTSCVLSVPVPKTIKIDAEDIPDSPNAVDLILELFKNKSNSLIKTKRNMIKVFRKTNNHRLRSYRKANILQHATSKTRKRKAVHRIKTEPKKKLWCQVPNMKTPSQNFENEKEIKKALHIEEIAETNKMCVLERLNTEVKHVENCDSVNTSKTKNEYDAREKISDAHINLQNENLFASSSLIINLNVEDNKLLNTDTDSQKEEYHQSVSYLGDTSLSDVSSPVLRNKCVSTYFDEGFANISMEYLKDNTNSIKLLASDDFFAESDKNVDQNDLFLTNDTKVCNNLKNCQYLLNDHIEEEERIYSTENLSENDDIKRRKRKLKLKEFFGSSDEEDFSNDKQSSPSNISDISGLGEDLDMSDLNDNSMDSLIGELEIITESEIESKETEIDTLNEITITETDNETVAFFSPSSPEPIMYQNNNLETKIIPLNRNETDLRFNSVINRLIHNYDSKSRSKCCQRRTGTKKDMANISKCKNIIDHFLTNIASTNELAKCVHGVISQTQDAKIIALAIVAITKTIKDTEPYKESTSMLWMTRVHHKIIILIHRLQLHFEKLSEYILKCIESDLFRFNVDSVPTAHLMNLTQLYLAVIDTSPHIQNSARLFIFKCLYFYKLNSITMIYQILLAYPAVLPISGDPNYDRSDCLINTIHSVLASMTSTFDITNPKLRQFNSLLRFRYKYEHFKPKRTEVIENLLLKIRAVKLKNVAFSFALLCKRQDLIWVEKVSLSPLLSLAGVYFSQVETTNANDPSIACIFECISFILKSFPLETDIMQYLSIYDKFLSAGTGRPIVEEAAVCAIIRSARFGYVNAFNLICKYNPKYNLQPKTDAMIKSFIYKKNLSFLKLISQQDIT